jgi:ABC-type branched-subunit amino acid transport system substrate-binding protein
MSHIAVSDAGASEPPAPDYCDPKITGAVEEAFEAVWAVIKANDQAGGETEPDCERRVELSRKLAEFVVEGVTDPTELTARTLASFGLAEGRQE